MDGTQFPKDKVVLVEKQAKPLTPTEKERTSQRSTEKQQSEKEKSKELVKHRLLF